MELKNVIREVGGSYFFKILPDELRELEKLYFANEERLKKIIQQEIKKAEESELCEVYPNQTWKLYFYPDDRLKELRLSALKKMIEHKVHVD